MPRLMDFCRREGIAFTVVGPESPPLAAGVVDDFPARPACAFSAPRNMCGATGSSKSFAKAFMAKYGIPTAH